MSATTRAQSATALRTLAKRVERGHPMEATPGHLRDAARAVEHGNHEGARRHLIAAMHTFEPRMLYRHGVMNDSGHARAREDLGQVHRQFLKVRDIQDEEDKADDRRQAAAARRAADARPGNTPDVPARPIPPGAQLSNAIDLVGPEGWSHGWIRGPGVVSGAKSIDADKVESSYGKEAADHIRAASDAEDKGDHQGAMDHLDSAYRSVGAKMQANREGRTSPGVALLNNIHQARMQHSGALQDAAALAGHGPRHRFGFAEPTTAEQMKIAAIGLAMSDDEVAVLTRMDLSAETESLATTHRPFGKPGGPGLWHQKGMQLPAYIQNIARALLRTGRARDLSHAIAIARAATKRWARGGGKVHPEVRAASAATGAEWESERARAHAHSGQPSSVIDLDWTAYNEERAHQSAHDTASATARRNFRDARSARDLHGKQVIGRTAQGNMIKGRFDANAGQVLPKVGGRIAVTHVSALDEGADYGPPILAGSPQRVIELFNQNHNALGQFTTAQGAGKGQGKAGGGKEKAADRKQLVQQIGLIRQQLTALRNALATNKAPPAAALTGKATSTAKSAKATAKTGASAAQKAKSKSSTPAKKTAGMSAKTRAQVRTRISVLQAQLRVDTAKLRSGNY